MRRILAAVLLLGLSAPARAQTDPERRRILHFGYDRSINGAGPTGAYLFFYSNQPNFTRDGLNLRIALAPVYIDAEAALVDAIGKNTDAALGIAGGGFADGYSEVRGGHYYKDESFNGHGASINTSVYHLFNEGQMIPLNGVARIGAKFALYERRAETRSDFQLPPDRAETWFRVGLRLGGEPPELMPTRAAELSGWYEGRARSFARDYGVDHDRTVESYTSLYWTRLRGVYRTESGRRYALTVVGGGSGAVDRFSAYRLGGLLPFISEFPLALPGYYTGELSARRFGLINVVHGMPIEPLKIASWRLFAGTANVAYLPGMGQPKPWNSSLGTSVAIELPHGLWRLELAYGYGIDAIREGHHRGAHNVTLLTQIDFDALKKAQPKGKREEKAKPPRSSLDWVFQLFRP